MVKSAGEIMIEGRAFGSQRRKRLFVLPIDQISPWIRIAHRVVGSLAIGRRIIFDHELVLVIKGSGTLETPNGPVAFTAGTLLFIPPFWPHAFDSNGAICDHIAVHFDWQRGLPPHSLAPARRVAYEVRLADGLRIPSVYSCKPRDEIEASLIALIRIADRPGPIVALEQRAGLLRIIGRLLQMKPGDENADRTVDRRTSARLDRAIRHINANLTMALDADKLSEIAGFSASHFTRLFREYTGFTPIHYLRRARINAARVLLSDVDLSIKEIAHRCGFDDPYHFSKVFHQVDGLPPSAYRQALLAGREGAE